MPARDLGQGGGWPSSRPCSTGEYAITHQSGAGVPSHRGQSPGAADRLFPGLAGEQTQCISPHQTQGVEVPAAGTYILDPAHSHIAFSVRHLMVSKVRA